MLEACNDEGHMPLMAVAAAASVAGVVPLLELGATIDCVSDDGTSASSLACSARSAALPRTMRRAVPYAARLTEGV
jgi:ankyrin repeat protein